MKLQRIIRDEAFVKHRHVDDTGLIAREQREITSHEAPLPSFEEALTALGPIAAKILECGTDYTQNMQPRALSIKYSKRGTRSAQIEFSKVLSATDGNHRLKTPFFQIDDAQESEQGRMECTKKQKEVIETFIAEAVKYIGDEDTAPQRQQRMLPLVASEVEDGDQLPGTEGV